MTNTKLINAIVTTALASELIYHFDDEVAYDLARNICQGVTMGATIAEIMEVDRTAELVKESLTARLAAGTIKKWDGGDLELQIMADRCNANVISGMMACMAHVQNE